MSKRLQPCLGLPGTRLPGTRLPSIAIILVFTVAFTTVFTAEAQEPGFQLTFGQKAATGAARQFTFTGAAGGIGLLSATRQFSCCLQYAPIVELQGRVLRVTERDEGPDCDCADVPWDVEVKVEGLAPGDYEVHALAGDWSVLATALVTAAATATEGFVRGRINDDDQVDMADAVALARHLFQGKPGPACADAADVNDDAQADLTDAIYLLAYFFNGGPAVPAPSSEPGEDPTPDGVRCSTESRLVVQDFFRTRDVNRSGEPDLTDAILWDSYVRGMSQAPCLDALDLNDDGLLDGADVCIVLGELCPTGHAPEALVMREPLTCGPDPTPDRLSCEASACSAE